MDRKRSNEIFISYRRADVEFTKKICATLEQSDLTVWVDWDDIPPGVVGFTDEIQRGIEGAVAFICILSPSYLESQYCLMELKEAIRLKKRIIPVVFKKFEPMPAPEGIGHINWVYFCPHAGQENTYEESFPKVLQAIRTDYEHSREHTKFLQRAIDWEKNNRGPGYLLKGSELEKAERWQVSAAGKDPAPTELHSEYILASRKDATRRQRMTLIGVSVALVVSIVLAVAAFLSRQEAKKQANIALGRQLAAQGQSVSTAEGSKQMLADLLAIQSMKIHPSGEAASILLHNNHAARPIATMFTESRVSALSFGPNGGLVASVSCDKEESIDCIDSSLHIHDVTTGEEILSVPHAHDGAVISMAFSPDGKYIVSDSDDGTTRVWEAATGKQINMMDTGQVSLVAFSPDVNYVAISNQNSLNVWNASTGDSVFYTSLEDIVRILSMAFNKKGKEFAYGTDGGDIKVIDLTTGQEIPSSMAHSDNNPDIDVTLRPDVVALAFSPDGKYIVSGSWDDTARVWEIASGREVFRLVHAERVTSVAFSPDSAQVASAGDDGVVHLWNALDGKEIASMVHDGYVTSLAYSPDGRYLLSTSGDDTARVWDPATGSELARMTHDQIITSAIFSPDGNYVLSADMDQIVRLWKVANSMQAARLVQIEQVDSLAFSEDGKYMATGGEFGPVRVHDLATGSEKARTTDQDGEYSEIVRTVAFGPEGKYILTGGRDSTARVWNASTGQEVSRMQHKGEVYAVAFSPNGKYAVSVSCEERGDYGACTKSYAPVWDAATGKEIFPLAATGGINSVFFHPDGKVILTKNQDDTVHFWDAATGQETGTPVSLNKDVNSVAFTPDGRYLATGSKDGTVHVWDLSKGKEISLPITSAGGIKSVALSPDHQYVAAIGEDQVAYIWEVSSRKEIAHLLINGVTSAIAFSPDGKYFAAGGCEQFETAKYCVEGSTRLWLWRPQDLIDHACEFMPRNLTRAEWEQYVSDARPYEAVCSNLRLDGDELALAGSTAMPSERSSIVAGLSATFDVAANSDPSASADVPATEIPVALEVPAAIESPVVESQNTYTEEFDGSMDSWHRIMPSGIDRQVNATPENGSLHVQLSPFEDKTPRVYWVNDANTYSDVQIEVVTTNNGNNANAVSLVCQYSEAGWYGFAISNAGLYTIYAFDPTRYADERYMILANGGSPAIKLGHATNTSTATCRGNELSLYINGAPVNTVTDKLLNLTEGKVGFGVSSPQRMPVDVQLESFTVSIPE